MARRFLASCRPFRLMYCQSFLVTSVRGIGEEPTTAESCGLGCIGFMNAALGTRFLPVAFLAAFLVVRLVAFLAADLLAAFFAGLRAAVSFFFLVAIACLPVIVRTLRASTPAELPCQTVHLRGGF